MIFRSLSAMVVFLFLSADVNAASRGSGGGGFRSPPPRPSRPPPSTSTHSASHVPRVATPVRAPKTVSLGPDRGAPPKTERGWQKFRNQHGNRVGDLTPRELAEIQHKTNRLGTDVYIVGSAAKGKRRDIGTSKPIGTFGQSKANTRSDIDYRVENRHGDRQQAARFPDQDHSLGPHTDYVNLSSSPAIRIRPNARPKYYPQQNAAIPLNEAGRAGAIRRGLPVVRERNGTAARASRGTESDPQDQPR